MGEIPIEKTILGSDVYMRLETKKIRSYKTTLHGQRVTVNVYEPVNGSELVVRQTVRVNDGSRQLMKRNNPDGSRLGAA
jgi:hypothetical protein